MRGLAIVIIVFAALSAIFLSHEHHFALLPTSQRRR
jgi:hypothetical protein